MGRITPEMLRASHAYTKSKAPWRIDTCKDDADGQYRGGRFGKRLFHYLSGGGMRIFGRTVRQEEAEIKRTRFLFFAAALGAAWLYFMI